MIAVSNADCTSNGSGLNVGYVCGQRPEFPKVRQCVGKVQQVDPSPGVCIVERGGRGRAGPRSLQCSAVQSKVVSCAEHFEPNDAGNERESGPRECSVEFRRITGE